MTSLADLRAKFPQYEAETDGDFLMALHRKFYPTVHPRTFLNQIEGAENAHATIKRDELWKHWTTESAKPLEGETQAETDVRQGGAAYGADKGGRLDAAVRGIYQGVTFGGGDEASAAIASAIGPNTYDFELNRLRAENEASRENYPITSMVGEIAGAVAPAAAYSLPLMAGRGFAGMVGTGAAIGAGEGAAYGFLSGEGGAGERALDATKYAALGGGLGAAAPIVASGIRQGYLAGRDIVTGGVDAALGRASQSRANRALAQTLDRSGQSVADVADALRMSRLDGQFEFRLADALGTAGQRRLSGIARAGGDASEDVVFALNQRQLGQADRVGGFVRDAFGMNGSPQGPTGTAVVPQGYRFLDTPENVLRRPMASAERATSALTSARGAAADVAYDAARKAAGPVDVTDALAPINARLSQLEGSGIKGDEIDAALAQFRARMSAPESALGPGETGRFLSDFDRVLDVKQDLQDVIETAARQGKNNKVRELKKIERELDAALEASSAPYRAANDEFRRASRVIEGVETGGEMTRPGMRAVDNVDTFTAMRPTEQQAARIGYGDATLGRIERNAPGVNVARPLSSPKASEEAAAIAINPDQYARRIARENTMFETRNRALGGSRTADNIEDVADMAGFDPSIIPQALTAPRQAIINLLSRGGSTLSGMGPGTRKLVAEALLSRDPAALQAAVAQAATTQERTAVLQALLRLTGGQQAAPALLEAPGAPR